jgi:hypothetical protein
VAKHKKRLPGRPRTGKNAMIAIRWPVPLLDAIDRYAQDQMLERPVALRQIVTMFLASKGMIDVDVLFPAERSNA